MADLCHMEKGIAHAFLAAKAGGILLLKKESEKSEHKSSMAAAVATYRTKQMHQLRQLLT
jgi:hypothetical protein